MPELATELIAVPSTALFHFFSLTMNYYNEIDPKAADWLRELIAGGHIPAGDVDERSITQISPNELSKYTQCHFFAGIGGWSLALELAGWPASRPVWTGSCPCQPFSGAGEGKGASDDRHLWPVFRRLIAELHPERVFGEQVAQAIGFNWLDGVSADLEADGYAVGAVVLGAHSVGAPHIRQRLYWLANSNGQQELAANPIRLHTESGSGGTHGRLANANGGRCEQRDANLGAIPIAAAHGAAGGLAVASDNGTGSDTGKAGGLQGESMDARTESLRQAHGETGASGADSRSASGHWDACDIIDCLDGKSRRVESGTFPLAHGVQGRVGLLRGYGNAIVPQVAAEFIRAAADLNEWNR
jgi:DNA (cytosine-5)-methyltransferase 1